MCDTLKKRSILNRKAELPKARLGRRRVWVSSMLIAFSLCFSKDYSVADKPRTTHYKQYAFIKLNHSFTEFYCLDELWFRESRWDHRADNPRSSAFGIPQILGLKTKDPIKQIDRGLAYIKHRYLTACNALAFHNRKGWY